MPAKIEHTTAVHAHTLPLNSMLYLPSVKDKTAISKTWFVFCRAGELSVFCRDRAMGSRPFPRGPGCAPSDPKANIFMIETNRTIARVTRKEQIAAVHANTVRYNSFLPSHARARRAPISDGEFFLCFAASRSCRRPSATPTALRRLRRRSRWPPRPDLPLWKINAVPAKDEGEERD